jgi:hypothetical protein
VKPPKPPKPPDPAPLPTADQPQAEESEIKKLRRQKGYERTLITGNFAPNTGKKSTLG